MKDYRSLLDSSYLLCPMSDRLTEGLGDMPEGKR